MFSLVIYPLQPLNTLHSSPLFQLLNTLSYSTLSLAHTTSTNLSEEVASKSLCFTILQGSLSNYVLLRNWMEETTNNATCSKSKAIDVTSVEPVSICNKYDIVTITGMEFEFYNAAMQGNINAFQGKGEQIESILTPNKNTILHIHFTNYTESISETFVEEVLRMCPALFLKTNVKDETILHIAARCGHDKIVKKLIECAKVLFKDIIEFGAEKRLIRAINDKKDTALHEAARYGHSKVVDVLVKEEQDHSYFGKNVDDETPLYIAVERQYWDVVDTILKNSNSPQYDGPNGRTALHAVVLHGDKEKVSKLLNKNLSAAKQADENGWVPLHLAALCASSEVVELLLSKDRSTAYMRDKKGRTALHFAALHEDSSVMEKIIKYCPDCCELVDEKGFNALHYTTMGDKYYRFKLKKNLQDAPQISNMCNEKDDDGNTPLHLLACQPSKKDNAYCEHHLLKPQFPRVDLMASNKYRQTVLDVAVSQVPPYSAYKNKLLKKLQNIGARLGGRVLDKQLREKKQEKRHDLTVDVKEDYLARRATILSVVAILIATVTFTAGFTLPGGMIQGGKDSGSPILMDNKIFITFVVTDSLSFILSTFAVFVLLLSPFVAKEEDKDVDESLLNLCMFITVLALELMVLAFGLGIFAVLHSSTRLGGAIYYSVVWSFALFYYLIRFKVWIVRKRIRNYGLQRVRDIQLCHTL